jgi:hypothetical protein
MPIMMNQIWRNASSLKNMIAILLFSSRIWLCGSLHPTDDEQALGSAPFDIEQGLAAPYEHLRRIPF